MADDVGVEGAWATEPPPDPAEAWAVEDAEEPEVLVSALEHYSYCPRQCGLIHIEQTFEENLFTVTGRLAHERVDSGDRSPAGTVRAVRSLPVWSVRLGLRGKLDLLEYRPEGPYPVEYKSGRRQAAHADLQLCAQALCLEEMLGVPVPTGAIFYFGTRKRHEVAVDDALRERTLAAILAVRAMLREGRPPPPVADARCPNCSLVEACLPQVITGTARLRGLQGALFQPLPSGAEDEDG